MSKTPYANAFFVRILRAKRDQLSSRKSQIQIAEEIGFNRANNLSNILTGRNAMTFEHLPAAVAAFEFKADSLRSLTFAAMDAYQDNKLWGPMRAGLLGIGLEKTFPPEFTGIFDTLASMTPDKVPDAKVAEIAAMM